MPQLKTVSSNGLQIAYETFGDPGAPPVLLVMGLGTQMLGWPDPFCEDLASRGHFVVRFDNRDVGASTHLDELARPGVVELLTRRKAAYTLQDMAADTIGLLDALQLSRVHLVGVSMGGFIAQTVALTAPERVATLTLIMTSTGSRRVGQASPQMITRLLRRPEVHNADQAADAMVETFRVIGSPGFPVDETRLRAVAVQAYERGYDPAGYRRQLAAVSSQPNRTAVLSRLDVPTLVMHGLSDPLVPVSGGLALARAIRGARFVGFHGMGHDLPRALWGAFVDEIASLARPSHRGDLGQESPAKITTA